MTPTGLLTRAIAPSFPAGKIQACAAQTTLLGCRPLSAL